MKIISSYKDYYDYLMGTYGIDEKIVYQRQCKHRSEIKGEFTAGSLYKPPHVVAPSTDQYKNYVLAICGIMYDVYYVQGKFYFGLNTPDLNTGKYGHFIMHLSIDERKNIANDVGRNCFYSFENREGQNRIHLKPTTINNKYNCPVILLSNRTERDADVLNPRLSDFGINQLISPHDMYIAISNFISAEKPVIDTRTNEQKIVGHGFDKKTSFRNV